jgi:hypothetical protein
MLKQFEVKGSPFERGRQMGETFEALISSGVQGWAKWPSEPARQAKYTMMVENVSSYLEDKSPGVLEEVRGISVGAGISFEVSLLLSAGNAFAPALPFVGCSSIGFVTSDVGPILGKTDDGTAPPGTDAESRIRRRVEGLLALTIRPERGHDALCVTPIGPMWAECGINEKGLCMGTSSGHPQRSRADGKGIPQHMLPRLILLSCADVNEAVDFVGNYDTMGKGINIVLVDEGGNAAAIESTYTLHGVRKPLNGVVFATNHYFAPEMQVFSAQTDPGFISSRYFQNSVNRVVNLFGRFSSGESVLSFDEMKNTLMDHHNPGALCQHPDNNDAYMQTNFAAIFVSRKREMWLNDGSPCRDRFERYVLAP